MCQETERLLCLYLKFSMAKSIDVSKIHHFPMVTKAELKEVAKLHQKKYRKLAQCFIVEGQKSILEFARAAWPIASLYQSTESYLVDGIESKLITPESMKKISALHTPPGSLAVVRMQNFDKAQGQPWELALDGLRDPGNMGTIIRLCDWFGIQDIVCSIDTVDVYSPKVVQASMGSLARVRVHYMDLEQYFSKTSKVVLGASMEGKSIYQTQLPQEGVWVLGGEANGLSAAVAQRLKQTISIPQFGQHQQTESLNVATATAIILSETFRRRG